MARLTEHTVSRPGGTSNPLILHPLPGEIREQRDNARRLFYRTLRKGLIRRRYRCEECRRTRERDASGKFREIEAHHPDYTKPLEVRWLCHRCHQIADNRMSFELRRELMAQRGGVA